MKAQQKAGLVVRLDLLHQRTTIGQADLTRLQAEWPNIELVTAKEDLGQAQRCIERAQAMLEAVEVEVEVQSGFR